MHSGRYYRQAISSMFISKFKLYVLLLIVFITGMLKAHCQVIYNGKLNTIGHAVSYYIDTAGTFTLGQAISKPANFKKSVTDVPNFGLLKVPLWLKITITNNTDNPDLLLKFDQASFDSIDFYQPENESYIKNSSGVLLPYDSRMVDYHKFMYELTIPRGRTGNYFVRIISSQEIQLPILLGDKHRVTAENNVNIILFGIFFGIIFVMFFYNLFIYFTVKDSIYLYYVVYILAVGLIQGTIEGYSFQFLWPHNAFFAQRAFFIFTALVNITGLEFVRKFLKTGYFIPKITKVFFALYAVYIIILVLTFAGQFQIAYRLLQGFAGAVSVFMLVVAIVISKKGYRPAKFFSIAWIPLITGIIIYVLRDLSVLSYNVITNYSITIGSSVEVILLSFALADRINILKAEREKSQEEVINATIENERLIREQNIMLEMKVDERTNALVKTLDDLQQAQTQLVEAEKMASLGQLTAGIAHEINNPINFVTSNINPLKRDIEMMMGALNVIEKIGLSDISQAEKQKEIEEYKEELDFDYLMIEIERLIKGINEGANRTADIVKGLKIFSRLDEDDLKNTDLNEGLESTLIIANHMLNNKIKIHKHLGILPKINCYAGKLNQVFLNIISNAVYAVQKRFGDCKGGEITIETMIKDENAMIIIKDNGTGMDHQTQKKIFEPFFTTKDVGEGTGLGLSIVYNTIKKHNGQIVVNSILHEGTEFILQIPLLPN